MADRTSWLYRSVACTSSQRSLSVCQIACDFLSRNLNQWWLIFRTLLSDPIAAAAIWGTTFPAIKGAQLLTPPSASEQWPIAIFSHGVGCSRYNQNHTSYYSLSSCPARPDLPIFSRCRLMYSQICGSLAARGYIVAAIEHRDGTGPCSSVCTERGGKTEDIEFLRWKDVQSVLDLDLRASLQ